MIELKVLNLAEEQVNRILKNQILDEQSEFYGGVKRASTGLPSAENAGGTPADLVTLVTIYSHPQSLHYRDNNLILPMEAALQYLLRTQGRAGLISMDYCNFDSPPDTAFVVVGLAELYTLIDNSLPALVGVKQGLAEFLSRTIPGLKKGGVHTANHRWVMAAALLWLAKIFEHEDCLQRAKQWLAEGIDCSQEGEWSERSVGIYNVICDTMFFQIAKLLDDVTFLEPVTRNLDLVTKLVHPNGRLVTECSTRQDRLQPHYLDTYYLVYQLCAGFKQNALWSYWAQKGAGHLGCNGQKLFSACTHELLYHLRYPQWMNWKPDKTSAPNVDYELTLRPVANGFSVIRRREKQASLTLVAETDTAASFSYGGAELLGIRPVLGFFGQAVLQAPNWQITKTGEYQASIELKAPYYAPLDSLELERLPLEIKPWQIDQTGRAKIDLCELGSKLRVKSTAMGLDLFWSTQAPWPLFAQLALFFAKSGQFDSNLGLEHLPTGEHLLLGDKVIYRQGCWRIEVTRVGAEPIIHRLSTIRGDQPRPQGCNLLINFLTTQELQLTIRGYKS